MLFTYVEYKKEFKNDYALSYILLFYQWVSKVSGKTQSIDLLCIFMNIIPDPS